MSGPKSPDERKQETVERYRKAMGKEVGHEEQKRRKSASRVRKAGQSGRGPRRQGWSEADDEGFESFEKIASGPARPAPPAPALDPSLPTAAVVAVHRGRVVLEGERSARLAPRLAADPDTSIVVGDEVAWSEREGVAVVEGVVPRRSCISRSDPGDTRRQLAIAANVDVAVIVVAAADPPLHVGLIDRVLLGLDGAGVAPLVCVTKLDLLDAEARAAAEAELAPYAELDVPVLLCSAESGEGVGELRASLQGLTCVFVGHSGVGKSTLLNLLDPEGDRPTGDVRERDGRGRHTTTGSSLRELEGGTRVIDTPGVRAFGLERLTLEEVRAGFADLELFAKGCRFGDCAHLAEPDCAVREAVEQGQASRARYRSYERIARDLI